MGRYTGPTHKLCRREGVPVCGRENCPVKTRPIPPGQRATRRFSRTTEYGKQLREKQKAKRIYGVRETQFRNYFDEARTHRENTGLMLLRTLERRLDNAVYRLGLAKTRAHARQLVNHKKIRVNGENVTIPSYLVSVGDVISVKGKGVEIFTDRLIPTWMSLNKKTRQGTIKRLPERDDIVEPIDESLVIDFYSR